MSQPPFLTERDNEDTKDLVVGILTRVIPVAVHKLREMVNMVHHLGEKKLCGTEQDAEANHHIVCNVDGPKQSLEEIQRGKSLQ